MTVDGKEVYSTALIVATALTFTISPLLSDEPLNVGRFAEPRLIPSLIAQIHTFSIERPLPSTNAHMNRVFGRINTSISHMCSNEEDIQKILIDDLTKSGIHDDLEQLDCIALPPELKLDYFEVVLKGKDFEISRARIASTETMYSTVDAYIYARRPPTTR